MRAFEALRSGCESRAGCLTCQTGRLGWNATSTRQGQADLAVGNAVGSSVFNVLGVLGLTASLRPVAAHDVDPLDGVILIAVSLAGLVLVARAGGIGRVQGAILVMAYTLYVVTAFGMPI